MRRTYLIHEELSQLWLFEISVLEVQDDLAGVPDIPIILIDEICEERVIYCLVNCDSEEGVELQSLLKKVDCLWTSPWELSSQVCLWNVLEALQILDCLLVRYEAHLLRSWRPNNLKDAVKLVLSRKWKTTFYLHLLGIRRRKWEAALTWEQWLAVEKGWR